MTKTFHAHINQWIHCINPNNPSRCGSCWEDIWFLMSLSCRSSSSCCCREVSASGSIEVVAENTAFMMPMPSDILWWAFQRRAVWLCLRPVMTCTCQSGLSGSNGSMYYGDEECIKWALCVLSCTATYLTGYVSLKTKGGGCRQGVKRQLIFRLPCSRRSGPDSRFCGWAMFWYQAKPRVVATKAFQRRQNQGSVQPMTKDPETANRHETTGMFYLKKHVLSSSEMLSKLSWKFLFCHPL